MEKEITLDRVGNGTGVPTPWGRAQSTTIYEPGLMRVETASHGGYMLMRKYAMENLSEAGVKRGMPFGQWLTYEEDCDAAIIHYELSERLTDIANSLAKETLTESLERYHPEYLREREASTLSVS